MTVLFIAGAKLLGVYFVYQAAVHLISAAVFTDGARAALIVQLVLAVVAGAIATLLMLRTESVGDFLGVRAERSPSGRINAPAEVLEVGIILIGIFVFLTRLPVFLQMISARLAGVRFGGVGGAAFRIAIESVPIVLAVYAVLRANRIADLVAPARLRATR